MASRVQKRKSCIFTFSDPSQEKLTSATFSIHEKGCLVGGRSPSFKHVSHETPHFTPHMSADSVHLRSCVTDDHGSWFRSGSHAPAQSVPSPRCGRPRWRHMCRSSFHLWWSWPVPVKASPQLCKACQHQALHFVLQGLRADSWSQSDHGGRAQLHVRRPRLHVRSAWLHTGFTC